MGTFLSDVYVRTRDSEAVHAACGVPASLAGSGWVRVHDPEHVQDERWLTGLAQHLSGALSTDAVAVLVHDSDVFRAWLASGGALSAEVDTWPGWPESEPVARWSGLSSWAAACGTSPSVEELQSWFTAAPTFAEETWNELAVALGIMGETAEMSPVEVVQSPTASQGMFEVTDADFVEAAWQGDTGALSAALRAGQDPEVVVGWKPEGARSGPMAAMIPEMAVTAMYVAALAGRREVIELLCEAGADPERPIPQGDTPLCGAATAGKPAAVDALLDEGVDLEQRRADGHTALTMLGATRDQMAPMRAMLKNMPTKLPGMPEIPSEADLDACEALLREAAED